MNTVSEPFFRGHHGLKPQSLSSCSGSRDTSTSQTIAPAGDRVTLRRLNSLSLQDPSSANSVTSTQEPVSPVGRSLLLHHAIQGEDMLTLDSLLLTSYAGSKVNNLDVQKRSALHHAVLNNNTQAVKLLLKNPNLIDLPDAHGKTARSYASLLGYTEIAKLINKSPQLQRCYQELY